MVIQKCAINFFTEIKRSYFRVDYVSDYELESACKDAPMPNEKE